jgi:GT2 family glycosyltransferase
MLSIVISAHSRVPRLRCALRSLAAASRRTSCPTETIIVNDGSNSDVSQCVQSFADTSGNTQIVEIPWGGRSVARNRGAARAKGDRILFVDADVLCSERVLLFHSGLGRGDAREIYRGAIAHLMWLAAFDDPVAGTLTEEAKASLNISGSSRCELASRLLTGEALDSPDTLQPIARTPKFQRDLQRWFQTNPDDPLTSWIGCTGGQLSIDRDVFHQLGGFDEAMGVRWGAEDLEFGYRAVKTGVQVRHAEQSICYHMDHPSGGRTADHAWACRYFASKHKNEGIMKLLDYFDHRCTLAAVLEACHVAS